jgi:hypothetical protein
VTNQYTPEDVPTVLRRMFSETIKLSESWEADGNRMLSDFEHGKFITESLDEWAYNFSALADEYESAASTSFRNNLSPRREWRDDWKDYTDDLDIPEDWEDVTYHNDELPSFQFRDFRIWLNAPNADWRFAVNKLNEDGEIIYDNTLTDLLQTHDINEVIKLVND